jgi:hypothetical protein
MRTSSSADPESDRSIAPAASEIAASGVRRSVRDEREVLLAPTLELEHERSAANVWTARPIASVGSSGFRIRNAARWITRSWRSAEVVDAVAEDVVLGDHLDEVEALGLALLGVRRRAALEQRVRDRPLRHRAQRGDQLVSRGGTWSFRWATSSPSTRGAA